MLKVATHDIQKTIVVDHDKCKRCGLCAKACTTKLLIKIEKEDYPAPRKDRVVGEEQIGLFFRYVAPTCANCRICVITCPREAIDVEATTTIW